jgi:hypothetical protein
MKCKTEETYYDAYNIYGIINHIYLLEKSMCSIGRLSYYYSLILLRHVHVGVISGSISVNNKNMKQQ